MESFIQEVTFKIFEQNRDHLREVTVVFPNRRAGLFMRKALGQLIDQPVWMPTIYSFEDFVLSMTSYEKMDTLEAVFSLYEVYKKHQPGDESFDKFFFCLLL